jgi:hypothetical protein
MRYRSHGRAIAIPIVLASLATSAQARAVWVMGGTQLAPSGDYFTEVTTSFTVPPAPAQPSEGVTNLWPGIEDGMGQWVLQSVLSYGFLSEGWLMDNMVVGPSNGNPNNTSCPTGNATYCDTPLSVNSGDNIFVGIYLDQSNRGGNCNLTAGTNCNYTIFWLDFTTGRFSELLDWTAPTPLVWAQGLVFEQTLYTGLGLGSPTSCSDYPLGTAVTGDVALYHNVGSNLYAQIPSNLVANNPGSNNWGFPDGCSGPYIASTSGQIVQMLFF